MNTKEELQEAFPKLLSRIDEEIEELRYLAVVDMNEYDPEIDDDFDDINPDDYNYLLYLPERVQKAIGKEFLYSLPERFKEAKIFENFLDSEEDLFALKYPKTDAEEEVAILFLKAIEGWLDEKDA